MAKKLKRRVENHDSSSSSSSSTDEDMSPDENKHRRRRSEARRKTRKKECEVIIQMLSDIMKEMHTDIMKEMHKQSKQLTDSKEHISKLCKQFDMLTKSHNDQTKKLEMLTESHNDLCKQLKLHTNSTSGDGSDSPRSQQPRQMQSPIYRLVFKSLVPDNIEKGQYIEISVALVDANSDQIVEIGPLSSATVELVVVNAEFNQYGNQYNWSRGDFESNIKTPRRNSAMGDVDQPKSIVSNGRFNLVNGAKLHSGSTIFCNSSNKKVRLGVMVVLPTEERVLEGLSNPFYVRGHDRPARQSNLRNNRSKRQRQYQDENGEIPNLENPSSRPNSTQAEGITQNITGRQSHLPFLGNAPMLSTERSTSQEQQALIQQYQVFPRSPMLAQAMNNESDELSAAVATFVGNPNFVGNDPVPDHSIGPQFNTNQIILSVHLIWDRPNVEPSRHRWNLDQMLPAHFTSLTEIPKEDMLTHWMKILGRNDSDKQCVTSFKEKNVIDFCVTTKTVQACQQYNLINVNALHHLAFCT